ncbi:MAG: cytochrome c oxidase subunit II [Hyphomicrobiaceae bacterium]|nr:cytochrome c oxidase subunit II [Hyphomicrobiaceae bacterium]
MAFALSAVAGTSAALAGTGQPSPWQKGFQGAATPIAEKIHWFHDILLWICVIVTAFVMGLLLIVILRFNERANPKPSKTSHNTALEVAWTLIPVLILLAIFVPSLRLLKDQYSYPKADVVIKATGNQWNWDYQYLQHKAIKFTSSMVSDEDILKKELGDAKFSERFGKIQGIDRWKALYKEAAPLWAKHKLVRLLSVNNEVVVPVGKVVHVLVTASDVIHAWTIPSFGSKVDAVPGRTTATWFKATKTGVFYGQCSELCGKDHAFMPIAVRVVAEPVYKEWIAIMTSTEIKSRRERFERARKVIEKASLEEGGLQIADASKR